MRKGQEDSREDCAIIPHHISWNIKWLAQFLGVSPQHGKAGEGGKLPLEHARILKNGAATIGVCSAAGRPWDTDRPSWPRAVEGAGMAQRGRRL
jgi:hypothetical protein